MSDGVSELPRTQTDRLPEGHWLETLRRIRGDGRERCRRRSLMMARFRFAFDRSEGGVCSHTSAPPA
jgi:hypothetical protein